jgi:hypothetical protein
MAKNLKLAKPERLEASYQDLVEELPRAICSTAPGVSSIIKLMAELGFNPKASRLKADGIVDLTLCRRLGR